MNGDRAAWAQRLYGRLPEIYRTRDVELGQPLLALVTAIAGQVAAVRQDLDDLWDDFFIETCDDWVVPYLGSLLGTRLVANPVGQTNRLDVRSTMLWRRSKGTPAMLADLAAATTGWRVDVAELFRGMAWVQNVNHWRLDRPVTAALTDAALLDRLGRAGDPFAHTADVAASADLDAPRLAIDLGGRPPLGVGRPAWGTPGRHDLGRVGFFARPLETFPLRGVTPAPIAGSERGCTFDPLGREAPLFSGASGVPISRAALRGDPAAFFGGDRDLVVRRMGVPLATADAATGGWGSGSSAPFTFGNAPSVALHPTLGMRLLEPADFRTGAERFTVTALSRTTGGDDPLGTLDSQRARLGDQAGAFTPAGGRARAGRLVVRLETAPGAGAGRFPATVLAVRDDQQVPRVAVDPATGLLDTGGAYQDALLVFLPAAFLHPGDRLDLLVAADGATYLADGAGLASPARAGEGQVWPPAVLTRSAVTLATDPSLHRRVGLRVPDRGRVPVGVVLEAHVFTGVAQRLGALVTATAPVSQALPPDGLGDLAVPSVVTTWDAFAYFPSRAAVTEDLPAPDPGNLLMLRVRPLPGGPPVLTLPQCEVVVTDRGGGATLVYLPEVTFDQDLTQAWFALAEDGSTYRVALVGGLPVGFGQPQLPDRALARAAAGQVVPMEAEFPLRRRRVTGGPPEPGSLWIDPERGRFCLPAGDPLVLLPEDGRDLSVDYVEAFAGQIGARAYDRQLDYAARPPTRIVSRSGDSARALPFWRIHSDLGEAVALATDGEVIEIADSATYPAGSDLAVSGLRQLTIRAATQPGFERPCVAGSDPALTVDSGGGGDLRLELNGLLLGGGLLVRGLPGTVTLVGCTLDAGAAAGGRLATDDPDPAHEPTYLLCRCMTGALLVGAAARVTVADSIVHARGGPAIAGAALVVQLERVTVLGRVLCGELQASDSLLADVAIVDDRQSGCVRFSRFEVGSLLPRRYRCVPGDAAAAGGETARPVFRSLRPASPAYAQLGAASSDLVRSASEAGDQVGAFAHAYPGLRVANLRTKLQEFLPAGLSALVTAET